MRSFRAACRWGWILGWLTLAAAAGADPWTEFEELVGRLSSLEMTSQMGEVKDAALQSWVERVVARVTAQSERSRLKYRVGILDTYLPNAFSLPGGYIWVTRGLLHEVRSDEELAGVLAHEVAHADDRDFARLLKVQLVFLGLQSVLRKGEHDNWVTAAMALEVIESLRRSRKYEAQADGVGARIAWRAGYDPEGLLDFLRTIGPGGSWLDQVTATHPAGPDRVKQTQAVVADLRATDYPRLLAVADEAAARGHLARAVTNYNLAAKGWPDRAEPCVRSGTAEELRGRLLAARDAYQQAALREPENAAAQAALTRLTRSPRFALVAVQPQAPGQAAVAAAIKSRESSDKARRDAAEKLRRALRDFYGERRIADALQTAQVLAPETGNPRYLTALLQAHRALGKANRGLMELGQVYGTARYLGDTWTRQGERLRQPVRVPAPAGGNQELLDRVAGEFAGLEPEGEGRVREALATAQRACGDLRNGTRLVATAFLTLVGSGSGQPLGRLSFSRFLILEGDIAWAERKIDAARAQADGALARLLEERLRAEAVNLTLLQARSGPAGQELACRLVAQRLAPATPLTTSQPLGAQMLAALAEGVPAPGLEGLQVRACLARMCVLDASAEHVEPQSL